MMACPGVVALVVKLAIAYVWPPGIVTDGVTVPTLVLEQMSVTCTPPSGACAGKPLESCSRTIIEAYEPPSAGNVDGNPYTANAEGIGPMVVIDACTVA